MEEKFISFNLAYKVKNLLKKLKYAIKFRYGLGDTV